MVEKEIEKPKRKKKVSETEETPVVKTTAAKKKSAAKEIQLNDAEPAVVAAGETVTPAKKPRAVKKLAVEATEEPKAKVKKSAKAPAVAVGEDLSESAQPAKDVDIDSEVKPSRKRIVRTKKALETASSDSLIETPVSKTEASETGELAQEAKSAIAESETETLSEAEEALAAKHKSPIFKQLAEPVLPTLPQENRARLQMQSPNRIFLYWSVKHNPFETLQRALPNQAQDYVLSAKLLNLTDNTENIVPIGNPSGSWWFNVNSNTSYKVEIGFASPRKPFVRLMYSNTVETPRSAPSPNTDWTTDFAVSASHFAEVLDASGYTQDAFDVALAGDDKNASDEATQDVFFKLGGIEPDFDYDANELRYALFALASGMSLESLRDRLSANLFARLEAMLQENAESLGSEKILTALHENFDFEGEGEEFSTPVFGASAIHFPRKIRRPNNSPVYSSHSVTSR